MSGLRMVILVMMVLDGECKTCHRVPIPHNTHTTLPLHLHSTSSSHLLESHMTFHPPYDVKEWNLRLFIIPHDVARAAATIALVSDHGSSSSSSSGSEASVVVVVGCDREEAKQVSSVIKPWSTVTHSAHSKTNYAHSKNITLQVWSDHLEVKETRVGEEESVLMLRHNCSFTLDHFPDLSLAVNHQQNDCGTVGFCWDDCQMIRVPPNHRPLTLHHQTTTTTTTTTKGKEGENNHHLDNNLHYYLLSTSFLHHAPRHQNTSWGIDVEIIPNSQNNNKTAQNINNSAARNDIKTTQTNYKETQNNDNNKIKKDSSKTQYKKNATQNNNTAQNNNNKTTQNNITTAGQDYNKTTQACSIFFFISRVIQELRMLWGSPVTQAQMVVSSRSKTPLTQTQMVVPWRRKTTVTQTRLLVVLPLRKRKHGGPPWTFGLLQTIPFSIHPPPPHIYRNEHLK
ncbi:hypothetical protein Pcinc_008080 [Petrolisthes cinctipes]|uniref:Uncharacterized protein n=1 Tax=Petrolisthes cinctipes TaxID=88211 RepID=A0AAE1KWT2_PETCI|nr:hypothetical protein Pcinc_008080 [Petrolisthes cinctipes]